MEVITAAYKALVANPVAMIMALTAVVCAIGAVVGTNRTRERVVAFAVALISAVTSWMIASHWRWPR